MYTYIYIFFLNGIGVWTQDYIIYKAGALPLSHTHSPFFALAILEIGGMQGWAFSQTICLGWPGTMIFPISASHVARITGLSHQYLA
jgi:hypothetical protein